MTNRDFVPALGRTELTGSYDRVIAVMTRERRWRRQLVELAAPAPEDIVADVGCGTGSLALLLKQACPAARIIGVDPDDDVLAIARAKAEAAGADIEWSRAMGDELVAALPAGGVTKIVSSLVFHQCPLPMKQAILAACFAALGHSGRLVIADYGEQRSLLMRTLFRQVQHLDGFENTQPNADGILPSLIAAAGFADVDEVRSLPTPTGSISLYTARKA